MITNQEFPAVARQAKEQLDLFIRNNGEAGALAMLPMLKAIAQLVEFKTDGDVKVMVSLHNKQGYETW
ncbi:hypothetical protein [Chitinibacter tainanensis]|uniref:hypothetical protein n=1 Tax=Chitinibacter tainanensis TaxID=230667 RepID=UPI000415E868|nr:hypothetical protein [Chitinibacter tainanensis]